MSAPEFNPEIAERMLIQGLPALEREKQLGRRAEIKREIELAEKSGDRARVAELTRLRDELART